MFHVIDVSFLIIFGFNFCWCFDEVWRSYQLHSKIYNPEELIITNVTAEQITNVPLNVTKWKTLNIGSVCYSAGFNSTNLILLSTTLNKNNKDFDIEPKVIDLPAEPVDIVISEFKMYENIKFMIIVLIKNTGEILWLKEDENKNLKIFWNWDLQKNITHMNFLKIKNKEILLLMHDKVNSNETYLELYEFNSNKQSYWIIQSVKLFNPTKSSAINNLRCNYYLSVPQKSINMLLIYKFEDNHFVSYKNISIPNVNNVYSFEIGVKSFIVIDGLQPGIFQFTKKAIIEETILNSNLQGTNYWLHVPIENYRSDVVLLAQRVINYSTHTSFLVEIITYNGLNFEEHEDVSCQYFGDYYNSLACLMEGDHNKRGISGATYLALEGNLALLIPGRTVIFRINSEIKRVINPVQEQLNMFVEKKNTLQEILNNDHKLILNKKNHFKHVLRSIDETDNKKTVQNESASGLLKQNHDESIKQLKEDVQSLGSEIKTLINDMKTISEQENKHFDTIIIDGAVEVKGLGQFEAINVERIKSKNATKLVSDIVMRNDMKPITANKTLTNIFVKNLYTDNINGVFKENLLFQTNETVTISGDLIINETIRVDNIHTDYINDEQIENNIVEIKDGFNDILEFINVTTDNLEANKINNLYLGNGVSEELQFDDKLIYIPQNLTVSRINGENFNEFLNQICLKNIMNYIPNLIVEGNIVINNDIYTENLNNLKFPEEYILQDYTPHSNISGLKTFNSSLTARDIRTKGLVDGINTEHILTCSENQEIHNTITFQDLEITEKLNVNGQILGDYIDKFIPNPTLKEVNNIKAKVNFRNLEVYGSVIIENLFNEKNFLQILEDVIYEDEPNATVTSVKLFLEGLSVKNNFLLDSKVINDIPLTSFISKDTDQILNVNTLNGIVNFDNLLVDGLFGNINVSKLDQECVKLTGEQFISSTLIFNDELVINNLEIEDKLNDLQYSDYLYAGDDLNITNMLNFNDVYAENMFIEGNFNGVIDQFDLDAFKNSMLSYTKDQNISSNYIVNHLTTNRLSTNSLNGVVLEDIFYYKNAANKINQKLLEGQTAVKNLFINGHLNVKNLNNKSMEYVSDLIKLNIEDFVSNKGLIFEDNVNFERLELLNLSNVSFNKFLSSIVYKNETEIKFESIKDFTSPLTIEKLLEIETLNDIKIENIFTNQGEQNLIGPLIIHGNASFESNVEARKINEFNISYIYDNFDVSNDSYVIKGDVIFKRMVNVIDLVIKGFTNNRSTEEFLNNVVYINGNYSFNENILFKKFVEVDGNIVVTNTLNGVNLDSFVPRIVLRTKDANINDLVTFINPVHIQSVLQIENELITFELFGCNTSHWINNAVFLNRGLLFGNYTFEEIYVNDSIITDLINDINMTSVISLKENQTISLLNFDEITVVNDMKMKHLVNSLNLSQEVDNTVMANLEQEITSDVVFTSNILVRQNINTSKINNLDSTKIVTTNSDQNLTADYVFQAKITSESDLDVTGEINGFNLSNWITDAVKLHSSDMQTINDKWNIYGNATFMEGVFGDGLISGLDLQHVVKDIEEKTKIKYKIENGLIDDYNNICKDINFLYKEAKKIPYKFEYFEPLQRLKFDNVIKNVHNFKIRQHNYLLVSEENSCFTHLFYFKFNQFSSINSFRLGHVSQIITSFDGDFIYLISRSDTFFSKCKIQGSNVWKLEENKLEHLASIEEQDLLQESLVPGTFYGLTKTEVTEFKILSNSEISVVKYRKWDISGENLKFVPRGLRTGLALCNGHKIIKLLRNQFDNEEATNININELILGNSKDENNYFLPGKNGGDVAVLSVGIEDTKRPLLAVANHEETMKRDRMDFIKIYNDAMTGKMVQKILTYKPSSLVSIDFNNGETLLVFLENARMMQIYEYKGIEGFVYKRHVPVKGTKLFVMGLPIDPFINDRKALGIVNENYLDLLVAVMSGNKIRDDIRCGL